MTDAEPFEEIMGLGAGVDHCAVRGKLLLLALYVGGGPPFGAKSNLFAKPPASPVQSPDS